MRELKSKQDILHKINNQIQAETTQLQCRRDNLQKHVNKLNHKQIGCKRNLENTKIDLGRTNQSSV